MTNAQPADSPRLTPVQKFGEAIADRVERWMPSPFLFAIILTYVAGLTAFLSEGSGLSEIATAWYGGFWSLLQFGMQMVLILVTASVVAYHPRVKGVITRLVRLPRSGRQAVLLVAVGAILASWISWGLGLIFGAILAREMGKQAHNSRMAVACPEREGRRRVLRDHRDGAGQLAARVGGERTAAKLGRAGVRLENAARDPDDRRLAGAVRPHETDDFTRGDLEVDAAQHRAAAQRDLDAP